LNFVSFAFLALMIPVLAARLTIGRSAREPAYLAVLLAASLLFYAWHVPIYLCILLVSTCVDYAAGQQLSRSVGRTAVRRAWLIASLSANLGMLAFFKYANFAQQSVADALHALGSTVEGWSPLDVILPIGISFYTFQSMSYTIDVYRGVLPAERSPLRFFLYVSFFPQLVAGPIVRAKEFLYQFHRRRPMRLAVVLEGGYLIVRGFFLKMVLADNIGPVVDEYWPQCTHRGAGSAIALGVVLLFSCQIFCDFAGYSSIARGLAYVLGFRLPVNFNSPYIARTFKEFWTRWHISLSQWLRDYLYFPLGGNRGARARTYVNLMIVMLLGGLWHGAAYTFVIWGGIHGVALALERLIGVEDPRRHHRRIVTVAWFLFVQGAVLVAWVFFRADSAGDAVALLGNVFAGNYWLGDVIRMGGSLPYVLPLVVLHVRTALCERGRAPRPGPIEKGVLSAVMLYAILTCYGRTEAFIYFQF
jgi:alginate O-acetyltransferase complex protein AlgI